MTAETPATGLTDAADRVRAFLTQRATLGGLDPDDITGANDFYLKVSDLESLLAVRAKPAPSGDEREALAAALYDRMEWSGCAGSGWKGLLPHNRIRWLEAADAVLAAGFRRTDSPSPGGDADDYCGAEYGEVREGECECRRCSPAPSGAEAALAERLTALADDQSFVEKIAATVALDTNHVEVVRKRLSRLLAVLSESPLPEVIERGDLRDRIGRLDRHFIYDNEGNSTTFVRDDDLAAALAPSAGPDEAGERDE